MKSGIKTKASRWAFAIFLAAALMSALVNRGHAQSASYLKNSALWFPQGKIAAGVSVGSSSTATALPATGFTAWICNTSTVDAYLAFGTSNAITVTVSTGTWLKAGTCAAYDLFAFTTKQTFFASISASSTTLSVETGIGTPPFGPGSGSAGGGGGGAATIANGADVAEGSTTDAPATVPTSTTAATTVALLKVLNNNLVASIPAGANLIGLVGVDQTTPGTSNAVASFNQYNSTLPSPSTGAFVVPQLTAKGIQRVHVTGNNIVGSDTLANTNIGVWGYPTDQTNTLLPIAGGMHFNPDTSTWARDRGDLNGQFSVSAPSASATVGIAPNATTVAAASVVLKASAGNLYGVEVTAGASAGYLLIFDATTLPANGTVTPKYCKAVAASSSIELSWSSGPPAAFVTGIVAGFSTTGCFTMTSSATAFISGMAK